MKISIFNIVAVKSVLKRAALARYVHGVDESIDRVQCSVVDRNKVLRQLWKSGRVDEARQVFDKMIEKDEFSWNTMVAAYANAGRLDEAREVFYETPNKSGITWSSLISGLCRYGCDNEAFESFLEMRAEGVEASQYTLSSLLRKCSSSGLLVGCEQIHAHAVKTCNDLNVFVATGLVDVYGKCGCVEEAEYLFDKMMPDNNYVLWTAMLTGYTQSGEEYKAIDFFKSMRSEGIQSNQFTFPSILTACAQALTLEFGKQVHCCIVKTGFEPNVFVKTSLVDMYAKCGGLCSARVILENMVGDDVVPWNSMIVSCVRQGFEEESLLLFKKMHARNMRIDDYTFPSVLNSIASFTDVRNAKCVHSLICKTGFEASKPVSNALVDMYAKKGDLQFAFSIFHHMPDKDVISWTSLVTGCAHNGQYEDGLKLFCDMRAEGIHPDQFVIASVLSSCAEITVLELGQQVQADFIKSRLNSTLSLDNSLISMYAKCGCIDAAQRVFDSMQIRDIVTWTALIVAYAQNGKGKESLHLYEKMIMSGLKPDYITFVGLLFACSHVGLVEKARGYFESMDAVYGIKPGAQHLACMIHLLGKSGKLDEAEELLSQMTIKPDAIIWKALMSACRTHKNVELAERAASNLFQLEPTNAAPYVMLSNIYSASGMWDKAATVRRSMKSKGVAKEPGCSWFEINGKVHRFVSEDRSHIRMAEIYIKIDEMVTLIKDAGYVHDNKSVLHDTDEEGKELGLAYHSEKLAVAFALLVVPQGAPIRIFKNLRVCADCHAAMKFISRVYHRHIVLRDCNCFHHFKEGTCSCEDYW
ncbi:hypothetical protein QQ045_030264 [Rhodiola kirilowii]